MRSRAGALLGEKAAALSIFTFHSFFYRILKSRYRFSPEQIITLNKQLLILADAGKKTRIELTDDSKALQELLNEISRYKCLPGDRRKAFKSRSFLSNRDFICLAEDYMRRMKDLRLFDFDDLMLFCDTLFDREPEELLKWHNSYSFYMVDEFQDIDPLQCSLLKRLSAPEYNVFAVGDDDQSIYSFRGASPELMLKFEDSFPGAKRMFLSVNFRSGAEIVEAAGKVIAQNKNRIEKSIRTPEEKAGGSDNGKEKESGSRGETGEERSAVERREFKTDREEREWIAERLKSDVEKAGRSAVIFRTNRLAGSFASECARKEVPFRCRERLNDIYDHFVARDILDYCALADGERLRSILFRIMNHPFRGISRSAVPGDSFSFEALKDYHRSEPRALSAIKRLERDVSIMGAMQPYTAIHYILNGMGYLRYLKMRAKGKEAEAEEWGAIAFEVMERSKGYRGFKEYFEAVKEYSENIAMAGKKRYSEETGKEGAVTILTYHASKGLEFDEVYLPCLSEGIIPERRADDPAAIEEERRLFYVGMTRARKKLYLSCAEEIQGREALRSRFWGEGGPRSGG